MAARFEIRRKRGGQFHFVLVARNGQVVATSETYTTKARAKAGIASVQKVAGEAAIVDLAEDARKRASSTAKTTTKRAPTKTPAKRASEGSTKTSRTSAKAKLAAKTRRGTTS
jgi:uncharacterized protein